ncbi:MAG: dimethylsulfonioproprionate lyase family protein [Chloroflexota bacterium]
MKQLLAEMVRFFEGWVVNDGVGGERLRPFLDELQAIEEETAVRSHVPPTLEHTHAQSVAQPTVPHCEGLVGLLREGYQELWWETASPDYVSSGFASGFAFVQLVGPPEDVVDGVPFPSETIAAGFSIQAPNLVYPPHYHKAIEYYCVLTGNALWQLGDAPPAIQPPGSYIFHDQDVPHAMETSEEPLLTVWGWMGDLHSPIIMPAQNWL